MERWESGKNRTVGSNQYVVSSKQFVSLKIYNILGREIATLVNEIQQPGKYEVNWDASNKPSGVYFYRITVTPLGGHNGSLTSTKKMLLLR